MAIDEAKLDELKAEHDDVYVLTHDEHEIVVRVPTRAEWKRFVAKTRRSKNEDNELENFVRDVLLYPSVEEFNGLLERRPAIGITFGNQVCKLAGAAEEVEAKKA